MIEETPDNQMETNEAFGEYDQFEAVPQTNEDNGSSNYGFDDNLTYEQSNEKDETNQTDETNEQETFMADLADLENANSLPSACDENSIGKMHIESDSNKVSMKRFIESD
jgi:hypothetical protein